MYYAAAAIAILILAELAAGRRLGTITLTASNSRGLVDIYTLSHIIHGFIFYAVLPSLTLAVVVECIWEILENSPLVINRYRQTASVDYQGDTILNSVSDVMAMAAGYGVACIAPAWGVVALAVLFELFGLWWCRDNLTLNVVMLCWPSERIKRWQREEL
jgi:hypothetical protein